MAIITLTSDWGTKDYYLAVVKGRILSQLPDVTIVDISHSIPAFDNKSAAFTVRNCFRSFPKGTVHIIAVDSEESSDRPHVAISAYGHYFIGTDNGMFSMLLENHFDEMVTIDIPQDSDYFTFSTRDRFIKAAIHLIKGGTLNDLGQPYYELKESILFQPTSNKDSLIGMVVYIDSYGNAITNISRQLFYDEAKGRKFEITVNNYKISAIRTAYLDVRQASLVALFGTHGFLEIAVCKGHADSLCGIKLNSQVAIHFYG